VAPNAAAPAATTRQPVLPVLVFGVAEIRRLARELEALEDFMRQSAIREPGRQPALPRLSRLCEGFAAENHLNFLQAHDRAAAKKLLSTIEASAPSIHMSFAADPSSAFTSKLVTWLRTNIHPYALLEVGLQPTIAAGCMLRTTNKIFDLSLRERFADTEKLLIDSLRVADTAAPGIAPLATPPMPQALPAAQPQPVAAQPPTTPNPELITP